MNYYQASRTIYMSNHAKKIEVKHLPSTYLGRLAEIPTENLHLPSMVELLSSKWSAFNHIKKQYKLHFAKCIAKDDNITDHYGSNFYDTNTSTIL